jgi:5-methylcytosine-specific restriction endonuclease McrA
MKCGETKGEFHIDHIKPRSKFIELELCIDNLQVLCKSCNLEKSNKNEIDYRPNDVAELQDSVSDNWMAIK